MVHTSVVETSRQGGRWRHSVREYNTHIDRIYAAHDEDTAASLSVGGSYHAVGDIQIALLEFLGVSKQCSIVDIGCGSGRYATKLDAWGFSGEYLGTDVVQRLLDYAKARTPRRFRFELVQDFSIPAANESADVVTAFSVLTHLLPEEGFMYMREAKRVLRPGGRFILSHHEFANPAAWWIFQSAVAEAENNVDAPMTTFLERPTIEAWAQMLGLVIDRHIFGGDACIPLLRSITWDDGSVNDAHTAFGQSLAILSTS